MMTVAIIGGGAAGFFAALSCRQHHPDARILLLEKSSKLLSKVRISGGGRCNVTHACFEPSELIRNYPRGSRFLKKSFAQFYTKDTVDWFELRGVPLKTEPDNRMFPKSNTSETIVNCLLGEAESKGVEISLQTPINRIEKNSEGFLLHTSNDQVIEANKVVLASGGSPKKEGLTWLENLGIPIVNPVPSLFTFNLPKEPITELMGVAVPRTQVKLTGTKWVTEGALLITHWGLSGPAVLKLSALAARELSEANYRFTALVSWIGPEKEEPLREKMQNFQSQNRGKKLKAHPFDIPKRLWSYLLERIQLSEDELWGDLSKKKLNRLINVLLNDSYPVQGKTTFKEEFVTCGGVALNSVSPHTMESKVVPDLYFAGELLDIDGVTGGFNFQAAWTTGFIAGKLKTTDA